MSDINITALIAQMPYVQAMANAQVVQPEAQQYFAAHLAQQVFRQQQEQVQKIEKKDGPPLVGKDKEEERRRGSDKRHAAHKDSPGEDPDAPPDPGPSPWIGHLVNKKV